MFGDPVSNPKGFLQKSLGELIKLKSGSFLPEKDFGTDGIYPVYGGNGISGYHDKYMFEQPMIVIGRVGFYCGSIHITPKHCWVTDNALYISEKDTRLKQIYLATVLKAIKLNDYAGRSAQPLISASRIYPILISVPPNELQEEYSRNALKLKKENNFFQLSQKQLDFFSPSNNGRFLGNSSRNRPTRNWTRWQMKKNRGK
ncbi:MAG: restriction endonuclease subunit S [Blastocatellia bacterium]|nr:restriction endonuclease subunit S [Blastocatellia bacterium]